VEEKAAAASTADAESQAATQIQSRHRGRKGRQVARGMRDPTGCVVEGALQLASVRLLRASGLAKMDRSGKADPYVVLRCGKSHVGADGARRTEQVRAQMYSTYTVFVWRYCTFDMARTCSVTALERGLQEPLSGVG
jgi:hypothetical protein